jgi:hypothetical protein
MATRPDSTAQAALDAAINEPAYIAYLDIAGDPIRVTTAPYSLPISGTGDADLDGHIFDAQDGLMMGISSVEAKEGGGSTVTATLSGLIDLDAETMTVLGDKANYQGRLARLWCLMLNPDGSKTGNIWSFHTGYMTGLKIGGDQTSVTITLTIESFLAFMTQPSNRTWLIQDKYDAGDKSAEAAIAIANSIKGNALVGAPPGMVIQTPNGPITVPYPVYIP